MLNQLKRTLINSTASKWKIDSHYKKYLIYQSDRNLQLDFILVERENHRL